MKIAITGHTAGIGAALTKQYQLLGHDIVGLSKRHGNNIRNIPKICEQIQSCDWFINNAQAGYAQTELLFEMADRWKSTNKRIIVISTMMTQDPSSPVADLDHYRIQKLALEQAVCQLRNRNLGIHWSVVRPGNIATSPNKTVPPAADCENWARTLVEILNLADSQNLCIPEISLGPKL